MFKIRMPTGKLTLMGGCLILKAGLAGIASLAVSLLLGLTDPVVVIFASLLCITPALYRGMMVGLRNICATFVGAALALGLTAIFPDLFISVPLGIMVVFALFLIPGWMKHFPLAVFVFLLMSFAAPTAAWRTAFDQISSIILGVGVAFAVNYLVSLLRSRRLYLTDLRQILRELETVFRRVANRFAAGDAEGLEKMEFRFHPLFRRIGRFNDEVIDLKRELRIRRKTGGLNYSSIVWLGRIIDKVEGVAHHLCDIVSFGPDLLREEGISERQKEDLDREIVFLSLKLKETAEELLGPSGFKPLFGKLRYLGDVSFPEVTEEEVRTDLQLVSLQLSIHHLRSELKELVKFIAIFLVKTKGSSSRKRRK